MKLQDYKNSNKYRIENTYVAFNKVSKSVDRWCNDDSVCFFGSKEDMLISYQNETHIIPITAEELFSIDERLFADYIKAIDKAVENGEIVL
jgi:hypothetical protein